MEGDCRHPPVGMAKLFVRAPLAYLFEAECPEQLNDFLRPEDGYVPHAQRTTICCVPTNSACKTGSSSNSISMTS